MKSTLKLFLALCLFSSVAFADGDMTTGGYTGDMTTGGKSCTQYCPVGDAQTDADTAAPIDNNSSEANSDESVLSYIQEYLSLLLG